MPEVRWSYTDQQRMKAIISGEIRGTKYLRTNIGELLLNWNPKQDSKNVIVKNHGNGQVEFELINSTNYTAFRKKLNPSTDLVEGKFFLLIKKVKLGDTAGKLLKLIDNLKANFSRLRLDQAENWVDMDTMNGILLDIEELMENVEDYNVLDELTGDF